MELYDPETGSSSGLFRVPSHPLIVPSLRVMLRPQFLLAA